MDFHLAVDDYDEHDGNCVDDDEDDDDDFVELNRSYWAHACQDVDEYTAAERI